MRIKATNYRLREPAIKVVEDLRAGSRRQQAEEQAIQKAGESKTKSMPPRQTGDNCVSLIRSDSRDGLRVLHGQRQRVTGRRMKPAAAIAGSQQWLPRLRAEPGKRHRQQTMLLADYFVIRVTVVSKISSQSAGRLMGIDLSRIRKAGILQQQSLRGEREDVDKAKPIVLGTIDIHHGRNVEGPRLVEFNFPAKKLLIAGFCCGL
jgi:hypothetical protein